MSRWVGEEERKFKGYNLISDRSSSMYVGLKEQKRGACTPMFTIFMECYGMIKETLCDLGLIGIEENEPKVLAIKEELKLFRDHLSSNLII